MIQGVNFLHEKGLGAGLHPTRMFSSCVCSDTVLVLPAGMQVQTSHRSCPPPVAIWTEICRWALTMQEYDFRIAFPSKDS